MMAATMLSTMTCVDVDREGEMFRSVWVAIVSILDIVIAHTASWSKAIAHACATVSQMCDIVPADVITIHGNH